MRSLLAASLVFACCVGSARGEDQSDSNNIQTVQFDGQVLELAFEGKDPGATIKEYLPPGEKLDSWTKLAAVREFDNLDDPAAYAGATIKQLKKDYPLSPSSLIENSRTGAVILDFVVWPEDGTFVEFDVFLYKKRPAGGLISEQYALRAYGDQAEEFLKNLRPVRERLVELMAKDGLQVEANAEEPDPSDERP